MQKLRELVNSARRRLGRAILPRDTVDLAGFLERYGGSTPQRPERSQLDVPQAADADVDRAYRLFHQVDPWAEGRRLLHEAAQDTGYWAGIPMPVEQHPLVIESRFPRAKELVELSIATERRAELEAVREKWKDRPIRNIFYSHYKRCDVVLWNTPDGKVGGGLIPRAHGFPFMLGAMMCSDAWGLEQEHRAVQLLGTLLNHRMFKCYLLTGAFLETSKRSGLTYVFRRLRPTVALSNRGDEMKILACLCLHPIGYYSHTWAGAMCPTDEVIAHLMLMRGDEPLFWRRANQHGAQYPESGL